jgi:predicted butyrate kinase (DUF1464 family)
MRVVGIDPGTVSIDACGLEDGRLFLDWSLPTADALADPARIVSMLAAQAPLELVAGPSGYGLPLVRSTELTETDIRLACLAAPGEAGGIGGLGSLLRALAAQPLPVVFTPGVVHLPSVPPHRKVNRVDLGTADKVCAAALAVREQARRFRCPERDVSLILLELGGAFTAAIAVAGGCIVDGVGGTSGPMGFRSAGAFDGEVAFLAETVPKELLFAGGVATVAGDPYATAGVLLESATSRARLAWAAYFESAAKAVAALAVAVPRPREVVVSGRIGGSPAVRDQIGRHIRGILGDVPVVRLAGFAAVAGQAAQGAALLADGLAGGESAPLVEALGVSGARGTALDYLYVISPESARRRIGIPASPPS